MCLESTHIIMYEHEADAMKERKKEKKTTCLTMPDALIQTTRTAPITDSFTYVKVKVKWSRYRPGGAQRLDRGIALLFHDCGTRRVWVVSSTPRPHFTPGKGSVPILQEAGWAPGPVWTGGKSRPHRDYLRQGDIKMKSTQLTFSLITKAANKL